MMKIKILLAVISFGIVFAKADVFKSTSNTDIIAIDNPNEDELVRFDILSRAEKSIRIVAHIQDSSEFGSKVTEILRNRMANGVTLSYVYEKVASAIGGDVSDRSVNLLTDSTLYDGIRSQVFINRPMERLKTPFSIHDLFHEKIIIVDEGTPRETIIIGGRNHDLHGVDFSDLTFIVRPVIPGKPYLGDSLREHYDRIISVVKRHFKVEVPRQIKTKELVTHSAIIAQASIPAPTKKVMEIKELLARPISPDEGLKPFQFRPTKSRLITNDLFKRIEEMGLPKKFLVRPELVKTDITQYVSTVIESATSVISSTYVAAFPEDISNAYATMLANGGKGTVYTNSPEAYAGKAPIRFFGITYGVLNLESYLKYHESVDKGGQFEMHLLDPLIGKKQAGYVLNHKKLMLAQQPSGIKMVMTGSDNFNLNSAAKNSEMLVVFDDPRMFDYMGSLLKQEGYGYYAQVDLNVAKKLVDKSKTAVRVCRRFFLSLF